MVKNQILFKVEKVSYFKRVFDRIFNIFNLFGLILIGFVVNTFCNQIHPLFAGIVIAIFSSPLLADIISALIKGRSYLISIEIFDNNAFIEYLHYNSIQRTMPIPLANLKIRMETSIVRGWDRLKIDIFNDRAKVLRQHNFKDWTYSNMVLFLKKYKEVMKNEFNREEIEIIDNPEFENWKFPRDLFKYLKKISS